MSHLEVKFISNGLGNQYEYKPANIQKKKEDALVDGHSTDEKLMLVPFNNLTEPLAKGSEESRGLNKHGTKLFDIRTALSYERTALAYERTLMLWTCTGVLLVLFGFTMDKVFETMQKNTRWAQDLIPKVVCVIAMLFGWIGLLLSRIKHQRAYKKLKAKYPKAEFSLASVYSVYILLFGGLLLLGVLFST